VPARWEVSDKIALLRRHDDGVPWTRLAAESGVPLRTLSRWARAYRSDPTSHSLARRQRSDHGRRRIPAELIEVVEALALAMPAPTVAFIHRRVAGIAHDRGLSAPSYSSVRSLVAGLAPGLRALAAPGAAERAAAATNAAKTVPYFMEDSCPVAKTALPARSCPGPTRLRQ